MKKISKITALLLSLIMIFGLFAGCGQYDYALTAGDEKYPVGPYAFYAYWFRDVWTTNIYYYMQTTDLNSQLDLKMSEDGQTLEQVILDQVEEQYISYILLSKEFERLGLEFSDETKTQIDYVFEETFLKSYTEEELNTIYKTLGLSADEIKDIYTVNYKRQMIIDHYFGEGGAQEISEDTVRQTFENDYARFKYIALSKYKDDGSSLSTEETVTKYNKAKDVISKLDKGADFVELIKTDSEAYISSMDDLTEDQKTSAEKLNETLTEDGLIINKNGTILQDYTTDSSYLDSTLVNKVFELDNNEYGMVETDTGFWIIMRCNINESEAYYKNCRDTIFNSIVTEPYNELFANWKKDFAYTMNEKVVEKYNPRNIGNLFFSEEKLKSGNTNTDSLTD